jgi:hypothetical protein
MEKKSEGEFIITLGQVGVEAAFVTLTSYNELAGTRYDARLRISFNKTT